MENYRVNQTANPVHTYGGGDMAMLLGGVVLGATLMYIFDPDNGRRRRALLSDQLTSKVNRLGDDAASKARDLRNRAQGVIAEASSAFNRNYRKVTGNEEGRGEVGATPTQQTSEPAIAKTAQQRA